MQKPGVQRGVQHLYLEELPPSLVVAIRWKNHPVEDVATARERPSSKPRIWKNWPTIRTRQCFLPVLVMMNHAVLSFGFLPKGSKKVPIF